VLSKYIEGVIDPIGRTGKDQSHQNQDGDSQLKEGFGISIQGNPGRIIADLPPSCSNVFDKQDLLGIERNPHYWLCPKSPQGTSEGIKV
jgi:hypothetical protein